MEEALFSDHVSSKIDLYHQASLGVSDTIRSIELYEKGNEQAGVKFKLTGHILVCIILKNLKPT